VFTLLASEDFDTLADLTDALKHRCAQLRIGWTNTDINDAYRRVEASRPLLVDAHRQRRMARRERALENRIERVPSRDEATETLRRLGIVL